MPLVDGDLATRMIRLHEQEVEKTSGVRRRVPIIAVSASLTEDNRFNYIQTGYVHPLSLSPFLLPLFLLTLSLFPFLHFPPFSTDASNIDSTAGS